MAEKIYCISGCGFKDLSGYDEDTGSYLFMGFVDHNKKEKNTTFILQW